MVLRSEDDGIDATGTVLIYSSYVTVDGEPAFSRTKSGYGYMVFNIASAIARLHPQCVRLLTFSGLSNERNLNGVIICGHTRRGILLSASLRDCLVGLKKSLKFRACPKLASRVLAAHLSLGEAEREMKAASRIHIHGADFVTLPVIRRCIDMGRVPIVTLHGLASQLPTRYQDSHHLDLEREVVRYWQANKIVLTVLTPMAADDIKNTYGRHVDSPDIHVVPNGTELLESYGYAVPPLSSIVNESRSAGQKIGLYVGRLSPQKNQYQLVHSFANLEPALRPNLHFVLIGDPTGDPRVGKLIYEANLGKHFTLTGSLPQRDVAGFYACADFTILLSSGEGWGLPVIEGFQYGLPAVLMPDMGISSAACHQDATYTIADHSDASLVSGLNEFLSLEFSRDAICEHGRKFTMGAVAAEYLRCYKHGR